MKVGFLGGGNLSESFLKRIFEKKLPIDVFVCEKDKERAIALEKEYNIKILKQEDFLKEAKIIFLCIKPQDFRNFSTEVKNCIIISPMAGIKLKELKEKLKSDEIVRIIPTVFVAYGNSPIAITFSESFKDKEGIFEFLSNFGEVIEVEECILDLLTVFCGCMPALVGYAFDSFLDSAVEAGIKRDLAKKVISQIFEAVGSYFKKDKSFEEIKQKVCSPGGVTVRILHNFEENKIKASILNSIVNIAKELT